MHWIVRTIKKACSLANTVYLMLDLPISQVNVATKAVLWGRSQLPWIPEACLYSNLFLLLSTAAKFPSLSHNESLLIPLAIRRL